MDDWSKEFFEMLDEAASVVDRTVKEVAATLENSLDEFFDEVATGVEIVVSDLQKIVVSELDENVPDWREWLDIDEDLFSDLDTFGRQIDFYDVYPVFPSAENNPACIGCSNYHGQVYNGNLLVCGMHPTGWDDDKCPDWESN